MRIIVALSMAALTAAIPTVVPDEAFSVERRARSAACQDGQEAYAICFSQATAGGADSNVQCAAAVRACLALCNNNASVPSFEDSGSLYWFPSMLADLGLNTVKSVAQTSIQTTASNCIIQFRCINTFDLPLSTPECPELQQPCRACSNPSAMSSAGQCSK
ncbi:hypothetical protein CGMCC3_g17841 [Colletotrichum fructicola]|nr:uncharacterized protein CGMCC3_g17841 [Colletotrichum fructicola]KAE9565979.1 hypothetical protein CGMCC3_g17841 [Colletotrichum fructicola]